MTEDIPVEGAVFCVACANQLVPTAAMCPKCGTPRAYPADRYSSLSAKSKSTSVLLAVFFGFWSYLYSFQRDKVKFWVSLAVCVLSYLIFLVLTMVVAADSNSTGFSFVFPSALFWLINFISWLISLVIAATKPKTF